MLQHQPQSFGKTENGVRRFAAGIRQIRDREERAVDVAMAVNEQQFHCKQSRCWILDAGCWMIKRWSSNGSFACRAGNTVLRTSKRCANGKRKAGSFPETKLDEPIAI